MMNLLTCKKGFTLLELVLAMGLLLPALFAIIGVNAYALRLGETSRMITKAVQDAHAVIEQMRGKSEQSLVQVTAAYPNNQNVSGFSNLPSETVRVSYVDTAADPLVVTVTTSWTDHTGGSMSRILRTQITQK